ncbi:MAG TPA: GNAT family N-acetyltransferase [Candidatus Baltobacteraceae bacterium]|nr:GNAT family N-acetyltransferase [Candidatus Baltobacteraceae bacterium]
MAEPVSRPSFTIRRAEDRDIEPFVDLLYDVADEGLWIATETPFDRAARAARIRASAPLMVRLVAVDEHNAIIGEAGTWFDGDDRTRATLGMCVAKAWRGHGVGRALLSRMIDELKAAGVRHLDLCVFQHNERAIALYNSFGFTKTGSSELVRKDGSRFATFEMELALDVRA